MTLEDIATHVLDLVGDGAEAEVTARQGTSSLTRFANSFIHQNVGEEATEVSLRVALDGRVASGATTAIDAEPLERFVTRTVETARTQPEDPDWPGLAPPQRIPDGEHYEDDTAAARPDERAARVRSFVDAAPDLRAAGYCETEAYQVTFVNTAGHTASGRATRATLDGIHQTDSSAGSGHSASSALRALDGTAVGGVAAERARRGLNAFDTKPGAYEVVLAPECVASIAIFLAFYGFNAKAHREGASFANVGEAQFDERLSIVDDVTDVRAIGVPFDQDGTPRRRVELVSAGVTTSLAHDRRTAAGAGVESTGHAIPGSEVHGPVPTSLFVAAGDTDVDDLIAAVERGLYVSTFHYCRVLEPKTVVVTGLTRNGTFMIENGRITGAVTNLRFTESFVDALGSGRIAGLGNDARYADSEFGPGLVHAPTVRLRSWNFTGGAAG